VRSLFERKKQTKTTNYQEAREAAAVGSGVADWEGVEEDSEVATVAAAVLPLQTLELDRVEDCKNWYPVHVLRR
jgi:hypothetical protein